MESASRDPLQGNPKTIGARTAHEANPTAKPQTEPSRSFLRRVAEVRQGSRQPMFTCELGLAGPFNQFSRGTWRTKKSDLLSASHKPPSWPRIHQDLLEKKHFFSSIRPCKKVVASGFYVRFSHLESPGHELSKAASGSQPPVLL